MAAMDLYPAIDLVGGRCVRLRQGSLDEMTVYDPDPVARALSFAEQGAKWIHVVDLDAALETGRNNRDVVEAIVARTSVSVQTGGGLREEEPIVAMLDAGASRVVLGTVVIENPTLVESLASRFEGKIVAAVDAYDREVAVRGWQEGSGIRAATLAKRLEETGIAALLATEVSRDGMLEGPDIGGLKALLAAVAVPVLASGGVGELSDLEALAALEVEGRRLAGAVVGTAIYKERFSVAEGIAAMEAGR